MVNLNTLLFQAGRVNMGERAVKKRSIDVDAEFIERI